MYAPDTLCDLRGREIPPLQRRERGDLFLRKALADRPRRDAGDDGVRRDVKALPVPRFPC